MVPVPSPSRRLPSPWSVEETDACFIVRDANGQALSYVYFEEERETGGGQAAHLLDLVFRVAAPVPSHPGRPFSL